MMSRAFLVVFGLILGGLVCSQSVEGHTYSASDITEQNEEESLPKINGKVFDRNRFETEPSPVSTSNLNEGPPENDLESTRSASLSRKVRRTKRASLGWLRRWFRGPIKCWWSPCINTRSWTQVLETDNDGDVLSGHKPDLLEAVTKGSKIKVRMISLGYVAEVQNCRIIDPDVCCQANIHISSTTWQTFESNSHRWLVVLCTKGNMHMVWYKVGGSYTVDRKILQRFVWFVYKNNDGNYHDPILSTDATGTVLSGSRSLLARMVNTGVSLTVVEDNSAFVPINNVQVREGIVSAQNIWGFGMDVGDNFEYVEEIYWRFILFTPSGSQDIARWYYETHELRNQTSDVVALNWYAGDTWSKAFTTIPWFSRLQSRLIGAFKSKVEAGFPIKVKFGTTFLEVDNVMISGDHVSAQVISMVAREDASTFKSDINWEFRTLSTTGTIHTYRPLVGSPTMAPEGITVQTSQLITWYVDNRRWDLLFHISNTSSVINGSALAVRNAVDSGADIRVGYKRNGDPGFRFQTADNVWLRDDPPHLAVQLIRLLRDINIPGDEFEFDDNPVWSFTFLTTEGIMRKTEWLVGEYTNLGRIEERVEIKFFVAS